MNGIPQLRVRTEFSLRRKFDCVAYGPLARVAEVLQRQECPAAGIVDVGTWGHVKWEKALKDTGIRPLFGREVRLPMPDGSEPIAWVLAEDTGQFYKFSTAIERATKPVEELLATARGVVRFCGAALTDPETFDYVDLNPGSLLQQRRALELARRCGKPIVLTSDNSYPALEDLDAYLIVSSRQKASPQHIVSLPEMRQQFRILSDDEFNRAVANTREAAERCADKLKTAPMIHFDGDLRALALAGKERRLAAGQIERWTETYETRLQRELSIIEQKGFESYFLVVADLVMWAKQHMLVGPGRGSSAGSLVCYLTGITEVDPIVHDLLFERFVDITRKDLPDIDIDFSDKKRDMVFEYLAQRYGQGNVARIGSINTMQPKTVIERFRRAFAIPKAETDNFVNVLIKYSTGDSRYGKSLEDTITQTIYGKEFAQRYPMAALAAKVEHHASHAGVHAAGVIVSNVPVDEYCTVAADGVAQIDKPDAEYLNLLKIDALGLSVLGTIEDAGVVTADQLYRLKLNDKKVFDLINSDRLCGVFQFEGEVQRRITRSVKVQSFEEMDHLTALARPGPLGGGALTKYLGGSAAEQASHRRHIEHIVRGTKGVVLYQEQVMRIVREIGKFSWEQTTVIRKAMSGRKGTEFFDRQSQEFIAGAAQDGISAADAKAIWDEICSFGAWGMNKSHTCAYSIIAYWCAWIKAHHPLEFAAAVLRNETNEEKILTYLRELANDGVQIIPIDPDISDVDWKVVDGAIVGGFKNLVGVGPAKAAAAVAARSAGKMDEKLREKIRTAHNRFGVIHPIRTAYKDWYERPQEHGIAPGWRIKMLSEVEDGEEAVVIAKLVKKEIRDDNEAVRAAKRGGQLKTGPYTLFTTLFLIDDSDRLFIGQIPRTQFETIGRKAFENLRVGQDILLVRGRRFGAAHFLIKKIRCLTNPRALV